MISYLIFIKIIISFIAKYNINIVHVNNHIEITSKCITVSFLQVTTPEFSMANGLGAMPGLRLGFEL